MRQHLRISRTAGPAARLIAFLVLSALVLCAAAPAPARVQVPFAFAPQEGLVAPPEMPFRAELCLNGLWRFQPVPLPPGWRPGDGPPDFPPPSPTAWDPTPIKIPSPWNVNGFAKGDGGDFRAYPSYPESWEKVDRGWLATEFTAPESWRGRRIVLHLEAVAGRVRVLVNGKELGRHFDSFLPWELDITEAVKFGAANRLLLGVEAPRLMDTPGKLRNTYPAGSFWGQYIAGVWQDAYLLALPPVRVVDAFVQPSLRNDSLKIEIELTNDAENPATVAVGGRVRAWVNLAGAGTVAAPEPRWRLSQEALAFQPVTVEVPAGGRARVELAAKPGGRLAPWTPNDPRLYGLVVEASAAGKALDRKYVRFGWREFTVQGNRLALNGQPIQLLGDAWHFTGIPQMTRRYAFAWYTMLKNAHGNAVRLHAQPFPRFYLDMADEMGVLVLDETAIWASHCGLNFDHPDTWRRFREHVRGLVLRDRNHASLFGYSVANEITGAMGVTHVSPNTQRRVQYQTAGLARLATELDPTRPWLSSDGDGDLSGRLPVSTLHYGDSKKFARAAAACPKPLAIGEASAAYDGTPLEVSRWGGDRAFAGFEGRMEGLAREAYDLIARGQRPGAAFASIFNLVWYALKPLPLGLPDLSRPPKISDGVFFPDFQPGRPGVQPERLGPYCTTLNPSYDPALPLYEPWPLLAAVADAFAQGGPRPSPWDGRVVDPPLPPPPPCRQERLAVWGDPSHGLGEMLAAAGVAFGPARDLPQAGVVLVDAPALVGPEGPEILAGARRTLAQGGSVLVWGIRPDVWRADNGLLPQALKVDHHLAVSLTPDPDSPLTANISHRMGYFAEDPVNKKVMVYGQDGPAVRSGRVLLKANPTDWRRWNHQPEVIKTGSVMRGIREAQPGGAALLETAVGPGRVLTSTLHLSPKSPEQMALLRGLLANLGVCLGKQADTGRLVVDKDGRLVAALELGPIPAKDYAAAFAAEPLPYVEARKARKGLVVDGLAQSGLAWRVVHGDQDGRFALLDGPGPERRENCAAYFSFWVYSPRPLDDLLTSPNVPRLDLISDSDDGIKVWLNGGLVLENGRVQAMDGDTNTLRGLGMSMGWNHILVKVAQAGGDWAFSLKFDSTNREYLDSLRFALEKP